MIRRKSGDSRTSFRGRWVPGWDELDGTNGMGSTGCDLLHLVVYLFFFNMNVNFLKDFLECHIEIGSCNKVSFG